MMRYVILIALTVAILAAAVFTYPVLAHRPYFEWESQSQRLALPASGPYVVAVRHEKGEVGRYTLMARDRERLGRDLAFPVK